MPDKILPKWQKWQIFTQKALNLTYAKKIFRFFIAIILLINVKFYQSPNSRSNFILTS